MKDKLNKFSQLYMKQWDKSWGRTLTLTIVVVTAGYWLGAFVVKSF